MTALLLANHPALDFLNTWRTPSGVAVEAIPDGETYAGWLVDAGLVTADEVMCLGRDKKALDAAAAEARELRDWLVSWLARWSKHPYAPYRAELQRLNRVLERAPVSRTLTQTKEGIRILETRRMTSASDVLGVVAQAVARLVADEDPSLVKRCAGDACTLWFLDRTRAHRRVFCSPAACGNRTKVQAFRARQRG